MNNTDPQKKLTLFLASAPSEESDRAVRELGKQIAQELYDGATQNADYEARLHDPQNPKNW